MAITRSIQQLSRCRPQQARRLAGIVTKLHTQIKSMCRQGRMVEANDLEALLTIARSPSSLPIIRIEAIECLSLLAASSINHPLMVA